MGADFAADQRVGSRAPETPGTPKTPATTPHTHDRMYGVRLLAQIVRLRTLAVALAVVASAYLVVDQPWNVQAGQADATKLWVKAAFLVVIVWLGALSLMRLVVYRRLDSLERRDVSSAPVTPPPRVAQRGRAFMSVGFKYFGELEERDPWQAWRRRWIFVDETDSVTWFVGIGQPGFLLTSWRDGSFVETSFRNPPQVRRTRQSSLVWIEGWRPIGEIYRRHMDEVAAFGAGRPAPVRLTSMAQLFVSNPASLPLSRDAVRATWLRSPGVMFEAFLFVALIVMEVAW